MDALDGVLAPSDAEQLDEHLLLCTDCYVEWKALQLVDGLLASEPAIRAPAGFSQRVQARVDASEENPIVNPCFVVKNWAQNSPASLAVNGKAMTSGPDVRQGIVRDTDGGWTMVVWFRLEANEPVEFVFENNTVGNNEGL